MRRALLLASTILVGFVGVAQAQLSQSYVPPLGTDHYQADRLHLANPQNDPIGGADIVDGAYGDAAPPSLQILQSLRPGIDPTSHLKPGRAEELKTAALSYGAAGGLRAYAFAFNQLLRAHEAELDAKFGARLAELVLPVAGEQTLIVPPAISEEQMAFALADSGKVAHETNRIFRISREARLASRAPDWRTYLVQDFSNPAPPDDALRPHDDEESKWFSQWVGIGWARGRKQGAEIAVSSIATLASDIEGMYRYRVLLASHLVEPPQIGVLRAAAKGRGDEAWYGDVVTRIKRGAGLTGGGVPERNRLDGMTRGPIAPIPRAGVQE